MMIHLMTTQLNSGFHLSRPGLRSALFLLLLVGLPAGGLKAQRDAPVYESYLPRFSIYHGEDQSLVVDFAFRKNGGPHEHTGHQCYLLAYLKSDEEAILKLAADPELTDKKAEKKSLLDVLAEQKLAVVLRTVVASLNSPAGRTPQFPDASGKPARSGAEDVDRFAFPFKFTLKADALFEAVSKLGKFNPANVDGSGNAVDFKDRFKFIVFVPVNDSKHADKVSPAKRGEYDFAYMMNMNTALLYFRPLPYEFEFTRYSKDPVRIRIN